MDTHIIVELLKSERESAKAKLSELEKHLQDGDHSKAEALINEIQNILLREEVFVEFVNQALAPEPDSTLPGYG